MVVLMGLSTFYTQRQMIARSGTTDPQQLMVQKLLLYVLPLSFAFSGAIFPVGVLLYWLTTNLWSMGQQAWVIKRMPPVRFDSNGKPSSGGSGTTASGGKGAKPSADAVLPPVTDSASVADSAATAPAAPATSAGGARVGATPPAPVSAPANRRPAGSRKNKSRRGGRR